jgi:hypothetical protein
MKRDTDQTTKQFPWKSGYLARVFELRPLPRFHDCSLRSRRSSSAKLIRKSGRARCGILVNSRPLVNL